MKNPNKQLALGGGKHFLSLLTVIAITIFSFAPKMVSALSYDLPEWNETDRLINSYNVTSDVVTLYVGNISVDGTSTLKYLYTDKSVNLETLTEIRKILTSDYASLLPTTAGQVAVSNDSSVTVNDVFTDAGMVAINKYPSGTVSDTSSTILYNQTQYNSLATASQAEISDEATAEANNLSAWNTRKTEWDAVEQAKAAEDPGYNIKNFPEEYFSAFNDSTSYPTPSYFIADNKGTPSTYYKVINGFLTQVNAYPVNRTIIKVVNTSANVTTTPATTTINPAPADSSTSDPNDRHASGDNVPNEARPQGCGDVAPAGQADLFQIDRQGSHATLYFVPIPGASTYHVTFGYAQGDERFGGVSLHADDVSGVLSLDISNLTPGQQYAFKIAPVNGCAVGSWSNWLTAKGVSASGKQATKTYRYE